MKAGGVADPMGLLPQTVSETLSFELHDTHTGMANAVRVHLTGFLPTYSLDVERESIKTTDVFIPTDHLRERLRLLPIDQAVAEHKIPDLSLELENPTNDVVSVTAGLIKGKPGLLCDGHVSFGNLRAGQTLAIKGIRVIKGISNDDAGAFGLLNNVSYRPLGVTPYNAFDKTGTRSIESNPTEFLISFRTGGNITLARVIKLLCDDMKARLEIIRDLVLTYSQTDQSAPYYLGGNLEVKINNLKGGGTVREYYVTGQPEHLVEWLAKTAYLQDKTVPFCVATRVRYDLDIAVLKLSHADPNGLILLAIDQALAELPALRKLA
jgi:hypothetical protein